MMTDNFSPVAGGAHYATADEPSVPNYVAKDIHRLNKAKHEQT